MLIRTLGFWIQIALPSQCSKHSSQPDIREQRPNSCTRISTDLILCSMQEIPQDLGWIHPFAIDPFKIVNTPPGTADFDPMNQPMTANSMLTHSVTASSLSNESRHHVDTAPFPTTMMGSTQQQEFAPAFSVPSMHLGSQYGNSLGGLLNPTMNMLRPQQTVKEDSPTPFAFSVPPEPSFGDAQPPWNPWVYSDIGYPSLIQQPQPYNGYPSPSAVANHESYPYPQTGNPHKVLPLTAHHQQLLQQQFPHAFRTSTATTMSSTTSSELVANHAKKPQAATYGFYASTPPNDLVQRSFSTVAPAFLTPNSYASDTFVTPQYQQQHSTTAYPGTPLVPQQQSPAYFGTPLDAQRQTIPTYPGKPLDSQRQTFPTYPGTPLDGQQRPTMIAYPITPRFPQEQSTMVGYPITPLDSHRSRGVVVVQSLSTDGESRSPDDVEMSNESKACVVAEEETTRSAGRKQKKRSEPKVGPNFLTKLYE